VYGDNPSPEVHDLLYRVPAPVDWLGVLSDAAAVGALLLALRAARAAWRWWDGCGRWLAEDAAAALKRRAGRGR
jgi:hypothetical protein